MTLQGSQQVITDKIFMEVLYIHNFTELKLHPSNIISGIDAF